MNEAEYRPTANRRARIARVICYGLTALLLVLLGLSGVVVWMSQGPEPGDKMILMALPLIGIPTTAVCVLLLTLASMARGALHKIERVLFMLLGLSFLLIYGLLWVLG